MQAIAFATALAAASAIFAVVLMLLRVVAPRLFVIVFNGQFFGADVASLLPRAPSTRRLVPGAIIVIATAWVFGLIWALLYNRWA
jgi:2TM family of unknown function (DUF5676)